MENAPYYFSFSSWGFLVAVTLTALWLRASHALILILLAHSRLQSPFQAFQFHVFFEKGLDTSFQNTSGVSTSTTQRLHVCSLRKISKENFVEAGRNDFCSDYKELKLVLGKVDLITVSDAILTIRQRLRRRGCRFPYILCKKKFERSKRQRHFHRVSVIFCIISDSCQSKT